jgi:hypothetical protein
MSETPGLRDDDSALVHAFLRAGAASLVAAAPPLGADALLRQSARDERQRALRRSQLPIRAAQALAGLVGAGTVGAVLVRLAPAATAWLAAGAHPARAVTPLALGALVLSALVVGVLTSWQTAD